MELFENGVIMEWWGE